MEQSATLLEAAKNVSVVLTSSAAVSYAAGYLALRARAHALGTDPGFTLVDQMYVFAGFRFALVTLLALLCIVPALMVITKAARWTYGRLKPRWQKVFDWVAVVILAAATLASFVTLGTEAVLLGRPRPGALDGILTSAILRDGKLGTVITLGATLTTALTLLVLRARCRAPSSERTGPLIPVLALVGLIQLILLPVQHGIFYADRNGRALARIPGGVSGVVPPVWLLDRGTDRASLLARAPDGSLSLVTVKVDVLDGIPVTRVAPLNEIIGELAPASGVR